MEFNVDSAEMKPTALSEREEIRSRISTMTFEELQQLKEQIGSKEYDQTIFGSRSHNRKPKPSFRRANKNRPREMSSKRPIMDSLQVARSNQVETVAVRDPRFDPLCGSFDQDTFKDNYRFLNDVKKNERTQLAKEYKAEMDPHKRKIIRRLMQRIDNQIHEEEKRDKRKTEKRAEKQEMHEKFRRGERPQFKRKSERRLDQLVEKYEELKRTNKLQNYIQKRSKKLDDSHKKKSTAHFTG